MGWLGYSTTLAMSALDRAEHIYHILLTFHNSPFVWINKIHGHRRLYKNRRNSANSWYSSSRWRIRTYLVVFRRYDDTRRKSHGFSIPRYIWHTPLWLHWVIKVLGSRLTTYAATWLWLRGCNLFGCPIECRLACDGRTPGHSIYRAMSVCCVCVVR